MRHSRVAERTAAAAQGARRCDPPPTAVEVHTDASDTQRGAQESHNSRPKAFIGSMEPARRTNRPPRGDRSAQGAPHSAQGAQVVPEWSQGSVETTNSPGWVGGKRGCLQREGRSAADWPRRLHEPIWANRGSGTSLGCLHWREEGTRIGRNLFEQRGVYRGARGASS